MDLGFDFLVLRFTIVIPSYNEALNIENTISGLQAEFGKIENHKGSILVVDDNSPDGTGELVKNLQKKYKNLHLITGKKNGLGDAYKRGFKYAIEELEADIVFEYDADGQHQPRYVPEMLKAIDNGADVAVGSRYIKGGSIPAEWGFNRKAISFMGNLAARLVLLMPQYHDLTTGFRATKTKYLKKVDMNWIYNKGFSYKMELLWQLNKLGAKIREVPIEFLERDKGESKIAGAEALRSLKVIFILRYRAWEKLIKVAVVGFIGFLVQALVYNSLRLGLKIDPGIATPIGVEAAIISNFIINNIWTFSADKIPFTNLKKLLPKFFMFNLTSMGSLLIQTAIVKGGTLVLGEGFFIENGLLVVGILVGLVWNYIMYTKVIWKGKKQTL